MTEHQCSECGKPLKDPVSRKLGIGPKCWTRIHGTSSPSPHTPTPAPAVHPVDPNQLSTEDIVTTYERVILESDTSGRILISAEDARGFGNGHRLAGPKYLFDEGYTTLARVELDERDVAEIRQYLAIWDDIQAAKAAATVQEGQSL